MEQGFVHGRNLGGNRSDIDMEFMYDVFRECRKKSYVCKK